MVVVVEDVPTVAEVAHLKVARIKVPPLKNIAVEEEIAAVAIIRQRVAVAATQAEGNLKSPKRTIEVEVTAGVLEVEKKEDAEMAAVGGEDVVVLKTTRVAFHLISLGHHMYPPRTPATLTKLHLSLQTKLRRL